MVIKLISFGKSSHTKTAQVVIQDNGKSETKHLHNVKDLLWEDAQNRKYMYHDEKFFAV